MKGTGLIVVINDRYRALEYKKRKMKGCVLIMNSIDTVLKIVSFGGPIIALFIS